MNSHYLLDFNASISQAAAKSMEHLSDFVFITMGNLTLVRRDAYLSHLRTEIKQDTLTALRTAPLHLSTLFPDATIKRAEEDIAQLESKGQSTSGHGKGRYHPYERPENNLVTETLNRTSWHGRLSGKDSTEKERVVLPHSHPDLPRASSRINDSYCITKLHTRLLAWSNTLTQTIDTLNAKLPVVHHVTTAPGQSQKKDLSPGPVNCHCKESCVNPVTNVPNVAPNLAVGARLQNFWKTWLDLGAGPKVVQILKEGYTLPFQTRPKLVRFPTVISCYGNPQRNSYLLEALHQLIDKNAVELVRNQSSLGFFNRLVLVPKPNNRWRPILDLSNLNFFLKSGKFKMETPETIRTSLQQGEWITSIDFKDAYFHIPIQEQSRKYLRFHVQGQTYQFKALPFGLSTAPLEFTVVVKEVKLMAIHKGIRIHQYLDDWLVRAGSYQVCLQHTQELVQICQRLGWIVNLEKSELEPKQIFNFVGYLFENLGDHVSTDLSGPAVHVPDWSADSNRKASLPRLASYETHTVASQKQLESAGSTGKGPRSLHPHLEWWLDESNVLQGQPLHPLKHALQIFTDASKERWGAHLGEHTARGSWSVPESKLHINFLELKAVFLALKGFQHLCTARIVLVATDNTTVVAYINKEGGMSSGPLCALLWRILTWCTNHQITLKARHIPAI